MSRPIDADKLMTWFNDYYEFDEFSVGYISEIIREQPTIEPQPEEIALHESCTDCPLYDKDRHSCPRFNKVIPVTLREMQSEQRWIPVTERLPEVGKTVLITNSKGNVSYGRFRGVEFWKEDGDSCWTWKHNTIEHVLAWMPLPQPWKGEEDDA